MIQVKEMMQDNDLKNSKSNDKGSRSRSQSMNDQSHYKQDKTKTRQSINVKNHILNVIGGTEECEERDLNIGGDISRNYTLDEDTYTRFLRDNDEGRVGERQRAEGKPKLLDIITGSVVPLLPVAPTRASSELEVSVDKLFDEGGSSGPTEHGDSASGGHGVGIPPVSGTAEIVAEDAAPVQPKRQRKRKTIVSDVGGPSHPPKKLREDQKTSTGPSVAGKSMFALQRLLAGAVLNLEVGIAALPTLPFITSLVSVTPDTLLVKKTEAAKVICLCTEVSKFEVVEKSLRDEVNVLKEQNAALEQESTDLGVKVADLAASVKVREQEVADLDAQVAFAKSQSDNLAGRVHELETSIVGLQEKVTAYENCMGKLEEFQDEQIRVMNDKFEKLYVDFVEMALHLEEKFYPHLLTTIAGRRWLLTYGVKLAIVKCLHSPEYLSPWSGYQQGFLRKASRWLSLNYSSQKGRVLTYISTDNIANHRPSLHDVFVPLVESLSSAFFWKVQRYILSHPETTTALSVTFASTSFIPPISTNDYDVHADGQEGTGADGQTGAWCGC
ncbi:hypothetical protein Tco_0641698 [Tanacetum coccineum]